jgi:hypothetical protein
MQSFPHDPQLFTSLARATQVAVPSPADVHTLCPPGHAHALHWQVVLHVSLAPASSQLCVAFGWQTPSSAQAPHPDHVPLLHVRVCVPHSPHDWLDGPEHDGASAAAVVGSVTGVVTDDQLPHSGTDSVFDAHDVLSTTVAPCAAAPVHTPGGNCTVEPVTVQSVPWLRTTQHAVEPQTPSPPTGSCSATFTSLPGATPAGHASVQCVSSTVATVAVAKQPCTSKHPPSEPSSPPASAPIPPSPPP